MLLTLVVSMWIRAASAQDRLDESWTVTVNGQSVAVNPDGSFLIPNISTADLFGQGGPGTSPDFLSDDFLRLIGTRTTNGVPGHVFSERFQITRGQTYSIGDLTFSDTPPVRPESIRAVAVQPTLTALGQTTQLHVTATLADGTTNDVTPRTKWTVYRTSNPQIATVGSNGLVTAQGNGMVFITAVNEGASTVVRVDVLTNDPLTTVTGVVVGTNGLPAAGVAVRVYDVAVPAVLTDAQGRFALTGVPTGLGPLTVVAEVIANGRLLFQALAVRVPSVPGGQTVLPDLVLRLFQPPANFTISAGGAHSLAVRQDGTLSAWGNNGYGQLGDGTGASSSTPVPVVTNLNQKWAVVSAGYFHTLAIATNGTLWAWGDNRYGQLGDGTTAGSSTPIPVGTNLMWAAVSAGYYHTLAVAIDGTLWAWGGNDYGQLGDGTTTSSVTPVPVATNLNQNWVAVSAGWWHSMALATDGTLWGWGYNGSGVLGDGTPTSHLTPAPVATNQTWAAVSTGFYHTLGLATDGTLWGWGDNANGMLGDGTTTSRLAPVRVATGVNRTWAAVTAKRSSFSSGGSFTLALTTDGMLWGWGANSAGQLGDGTTETQVVPVPVATNLSKTWLAVSSGGFHTLALACDGTLWSWGANDSGQLGGGTPATLPPIPLVTNLNLTWAAISAGDSHSLALATNGSLWGWGNNSNGQLGDGTTSAHLVPKLLSTNRNWSTFSAGYSHTLALATDGTLWGWGYNGTGQLGDGTTTTQLEPVLVTGGGNLIWSAVSTGGGRSFYSPNFRAAHTLAMATDGTLWAWGNNQSGQLGDGTTALTRPSPGPVVTNLNQTWKAVSVGSALEAHTTAISTDGKLWAWGANSFGQLGDGTAIRRLSPVPIATNLSLTWSAVSAAGLYTLALATDGTLWAWGYNSNGQLGDGTTTRRSVPVQVVTNLNRTWAAVSATADADGRGHTLALGIDGTLWAWGDNSYGQLGTLGFPTVPTPVATNMNGMWSAVSAGVNHSLALTTNGVLFGWGDNKYGQLGINPWTQVLGGAVWGTASSPSPAPVPAPLAHATSFSSVTLTMKDIGEVQLIVGEAPPVVTYIIEASADLLHWIPISTNVATRDAIVFTDPLATNFNYRFYRAVQKP